jgi:transcription elongation factor GreA
MQTPYRKPGKYALQAQDPFLSAEKLEIIKNKLEKLLKTRYPLAAEVSRLAELGDFSENVEYQLAKGKLRGVNSMILKLENQIKNAVIINPKNNIGIVQLGNKATVRLGSGETKTYQILGSAETDPKKGIISQNSPLGILLLGKKVGDVFGVNLKDKIVEYKIVKIE